MARRRNSELMTPLAKILEGANEFVRVSDGYSGIHYKEAEIAKDELLKAKRAIMVFYNLLAVEGPEAYPQQDFKVLAEHAECLVDFNDSPPVGLDRNVLGSDLIAVIEGTIGRKIP